MISACASTTPSPELVTARIAYLQATTVGTPVAPAPMLDAQRDLNAAEREHYYNPMSVRERHLAYLATREAQIAMARGSAQAARRQSEEAKKQYSALLEGKVSSQAVALAEEKHRLEVAENERDAAVKRLEQVANAARGGKTNQCAEAQPQHEKSARAR